MTGSPVTTLAAEAARTVRRRLRAARGRSAPRLRGHMHDFGMPERASAPEHVADDAELDALRGELVRELDRLAADDEDCSADFRRA